MKNSFINYRKVLIVGLGMIGGSYAEKLSALGFEVGAIVRRQEVLDYALERGLIAHGRIEVTREYVSQFDLVISALYPKAFVEWVRKYQDFFKSGAVITDVTGVKRAVVPAVQSILREDVEFVPSHPMAGRERSGVEFADSKVFAGANFIITPTERNTPEGIELVRSLACILGFRHIAVLSPEAHDEMIGFLSQLTHCIAVALMDCKESEHLVEYTGDSFRDLTRIARINENMWTELFLENRDELLKQMDLFLEKFTQLRDALAKQLGISTAYGNLSAKKCAREAQFLQSRGHIVALLDVAANSSQIPPGTADVHLVILSSQSAETGKDTASDVAEIAIPSIAALPPLVALSRRMSVACNHSHSIALFGALFFLLAATIFFPWFDGSFMSPHIAVTCLISLVLLALLPIRRI